MILKLRAGRTKFTKFDFWANWIGGNKTSLNLIEYETSHLALLVDAENSGFLKTIFGLLT